MNSGNSGSIQSSSGGDEDEYDSRDHHDLISAFINNPSTQMCPIPNSQPPPFSTQQYTQYYPSSSVFHPPLPPPSNSLLFSQPKCTASASISTHPILGSNNIQASSSSSASQAKEKAVVVVRRHSKKRSRASRRAPTTVLTTNTSNFRAMVQEFTGIPSPPFSFPTTTCRFIDLFNTTPAAAAASPLKPSAHKIQIPSIINETSSLSSLGMVDAIAVTSMAINSPPSKFPSTNVSSSLVTKSPLYNSIFKLQETEGFEMQGNAKNIANTYTRELPLRNKSSLGSNVGVGLSEWADQVPLQSCQLENYGDSQMVSKMKYTASSSSDFHGERDSENVSLRGEGMVDSWICSSD